MRSLDLPLATVRHAIYKTPHEAGYKIRVRVEHVLVTYVLPGHVYCALTVYFLGSTPLRLFWRTLLAKTELRLYLNYVENLFSDCFGNNLVDDLRDSDAEDIGKS